MRAIVCRGCEETGSACVSVCVRCVRRRRWSGRCWCCYDGDLTRSDPYRLIYIHISFISCPAPCVVSEDLLYHLDPLAHLSIHSHSLSPYIKTPSFYSSSVFLSLCRPWVETVPWFSVLCGIRYHLHLCISSCVYVLSNLRIRTVTVFVYHLFYVLPSLG